MSYKTLLSLSKCMNDLDIACAIDPVAHFLPCCFFIVKSAFVSKSISVKVKR